MNVYQSQAKTTTVATVGDETAATDRVMFTNEGELEFDEDEMAALKGSV